jgi:ParB family chromosome partitioning protein
MSKPTNTVAVNRANDVVVNVGKVVVPHQRLRVADDVGQLAASIRDNGLLHPVILRRDDKRRLILVAGRRRLEAVKSLGHEEIRACVLNVDETQALLMEIDENLQRSELTHLERARHVAERKRVWEALHPETKHGGTPGAGRGKKKREAPKDAESASLGDGPPAESFVKATAKATRMAPRTVSESAQIGNNLCREAQELLVGTEAEDRKIDLIRLARMTPAEQVRAARLIRDGEAGSVEEAMQKAGGRMREEGQETGEIKAQGVGVIRAHEAINILSRIPKNDRLLDSGFRIVEDWIKHARQVRELGKAFGNR